MLAVCWWEEEQSETMNTVVDTIETIVIRKKSKKFFEKIKCTCIFNYFLPHQNSLFIPENIYMLEVILVRSKGIYIEEFPVFRAGCSQFISLCPPWKRGHNKKFLVKFCFWQKWVNIIFYIRVLALNIRGLNVAISVWNGTVGKKIEHELCLSVKHI